MTRHYLDHASTSPLRPESAAAMAEALTGIVGDPGRIHHEGMVARHAVETARQQVTDMLDARGREVVFTSGATESIAMACWGASRRDGRRHSVMSAVEHSAVRRQADRGPCTVVGVDRTGRVDPDEIMAGVTDDTGIVHLQLANHEVGTAMTSQRWPTPVASATCSATWTQQPPSARWPCHSGTWVAA